MFLFVRYILWGQWLLLKQLLNYFLHSSALNSYDVERVFAENLRVTTCLSKTSPSSSISRDTKVVLINHRCFSDFFIDGFILKKCTHLSRWAVGIFFPIFGLYGLISGRILFFHRGKTPRKTLASKIALHLEKNPDRPLIVYPEGTRYLGTTPRPLKHGVIKICFEQNLPCQIAIIWGKDRILNEKTFSVSYDQLCIYSFSNVFLPAEYVDFDSFYVAISMTWENMWAQVSSEYPSL